MPGFIAVADDFDPIPSASARASVDVAPQAPDTATALGILVSSEGDVPAALGVDRETLVALGFEGKVGQATLLVHRGSVLVATGIGAPGELDATRLRDAGAAFGSAASKHMRLALDLAGVTSVSDDVAAQAIVEGVLLARYSYTGLKAVAGDPPVTHLTLVSATSQRDGAEAGAARGEVFAAAHRVSRDLAITPPAHLTARRLGELAVDMAGRSGLEVEIFDRDRLMELGCGGLLAVNAGSSEEPRMIKLSYRPDAASIPHVSLVGKGVTYDSGGISLKPSNASHASMKNDMTGAGAVFAAMSVLRELDCPTAVTAFLSCTDNMPSGTALKLGDVITLRGGKTVEVMNTDAEGRLVMADALVLASEEPTDAIVDIATLTGACMRALGTQIAGVMGNSQSVVDQLTTAGAEADEKLWQFPLEPRYRKSLDSEVADLRNIGGANAGQITAALFLQEFVDGHPWAHVDIAGPSSNDVADGWRIKGTTGFGARMLLEFVLGFTAPPGSQPAI